MRILPLTAILLALGAAPAAAAAPAGLPVGVAKANQSRLGRGFGRTSFRSRPRVAPASRYRRSPYRARPHFGRRIFRGVLQALGIAYLAHLLFGWGAGGGSPLGLLLLLGLILLVATRRRRRVVYSRW
jgi:MYXO-CTERM domain-containing protein